MVVRVALVKDDELVVRGLASMLRHREDFEHVDLAKQLGIDIALIDTIASTGDSDRTLARLLADPRIGKVVVYTWNFQPWSAGQWIRQGASGYLSKSLPFHDPGRGPTRHPCWTDHRGALPTDPGDDLAMAGRSTA